MYGSRYHGTAYCVVEFEKRQMVNDPPWALTEASDWLRHPKGGRG